MSLELESELEVGLDAVRRAMSVCQRVREQLVTADTLTKKDRSPVTVADFASQAIVCAALADVFPNDPIVGEEAAGELRQPAQAVTREAVVHHVRSVLPAADEARTLEWIDRGGADGSTDRYWTLDPIDGTKGFLRGEQYAVALALLIEKKVALGILGCPNLTTLRGKGVLMYAVRGRGTWMLEAGSKGSAVRLASSGQVPREAVRFCESVESGHSDQSTSQRIAASLGITAQPLRMDSQVKYAAVAMGQAQIYLRLPTKADYREKIWDHAAGMIVVAEAGGKVTDMAGRDLDFSQGRRLERNHGIIATHGIDYDSVVKAVGQSGATGA